MCPRMALATRKTRTSCQRLATSVRTQKPTRIIADALHMQTCGVTALAHIDRPETVGSGLHTTGTRQRHTMRLIQVYTKTRGRCFQPPSITFLPFICYRMLPLRRWQRRRWVILPTLWGITATCHRWRRATPFCGSVAARTMACAPGASAATGAARRRPRTGASRASPS